MKYPYPQVGSLVMLHEHCSLLRATPPIERGIGIVLEKKVSKSSLQREIYWRVHWFNNSHEDCDYLARHLKLITV